MFEYALVVYRGSKVEAFSATPEPLIMHMLGMGLDEKSAGVYKRIDIVEEPVMTNV
jgi:hypothetical protein